MPSLGRSSTRKKLWIGFLTLIVIVCIYIYFVPQKIQSRNDVLRPTIVRFKWLPLHNVTSLTKCRNSLQGPTYITDELGYICLLPWVESSGCCSTDHGRRFDCSGCVDNSCCSVYEHCVSCCLSPEKKQVLQLMLAQATQSYHPLYTLVRDQFEFCLTKCRTSSQSVHHENSYRNPDAKYCYGPTDGNIGLYQTTLKAK